MANVFTMIDNLIKYLNNQNTLNQTNPLNLKNYANKISDFLKKSKEETNSANTKGKYFEEFIKDLFANTMTLTANTKWNKRVRDIDNVFAYHGNNTTPPDAILSGNHNDAIEFKKQSSTGQIQLNSSYFHHDLSNTDPRITKTCKQDVKNDIGKSTWTKDLLYIIGSISKQGTLNSIIMFYGRDYANKNIEYKRIEDNISTLLIPPLWSDTLKTILHMWFTSTYKNNTKEFNNFNAFKKYIIDRLSTKELQNISSTSHQNGSKINISSSDFKKIMFSNDGSAWLSTTIYKSLISPIWRDTIIEILHLWYKSYNGQRKVYPDITLRKEYKGQKEKEFKKFRKVIMGRLHNKNRHNYITPYTQEIGRVNNVDNLGTYLRVRGMWVLPSPIRLINTLIYSNNKTVSESPIFKQFKANGQKNLWHQNKFSLVLVMDCTKYKQFTNSDNYKTLQNQINHLSNSEKTYNKVYRIPIVLKNPDNNDRQNGYIIIYTFNKNLKD